jgi:hypothetical protein
VFHFFQDIGGSRGPVERFQSFVMAVDVGADGHDEFFQIAVKTPRRSRFCVRSRKKRSTMLREGAQLGVKWQMKARVSRQPAPHLGVLWVA